MRLITGKGLLLALGMTLAIATHDSAAGVGVDATLVAGLLAAVSVSGLVEWLMGSRHAWIVVDAYALAALVIPSWAAFLPVVAFDTARVPVPRTGTASSGTPSDAGPAIAGMLARWAWIVPACAAPIRMHDAIAVNVTLTIAAMTGFAFGACAAAASRAHSELLVLKDHARASSRSARTRLADLTEERDRSVRMATLAERTRIAREIHDNVGHLLTRAIMQTQAGKAVADATGDAVASRGFADVGGTLDDAMTMVRRSVHDLEDDGTDFTARITDAAQSFDAAAPGFTVALANGIASAPAPVARCFATVIREALANVVHHSDAREATVTLRDFPAFWQLVILDDGPAKTHGTMTDAPKTDVEGLPRGMGIADIEARVRALDGTAVCGPYDGGWRVFVSVPKAQWRSRA
ncbi:two-component sensor histidine kinase [Bifidobacterium sp. 82T24]|uniref:sensor histidine kinase n=1 Tax=Bifidobacterium pluvialisilvae TaxID=2834436 RepID=UPI001C5A5431|nr:histidine kinase [Bifidobacterium pluvialisilvae]MBW3087912.1 two-component sensor histidine kinase [Bifidobacterium pluvialisilvae]